MSHIYDIIMIMPDYLVKGNICSPSIFRKEVTYVTHGSYSDEYSASLPYKYVSMYTHTTSVLHLRVSQSPSHDLQPRVNIAALSTLLSLVDTYYQ